MKTTSKNTNYSNPLEIEINSNFT